MWNIFVLCFNWTCGTFTLTHDRSQYSAEHKRVWHGAAPGSRTRLSPTWSLRLGLGVVLGPGPSRPAKSLDAEWGGGRACHQSNAKDHLTNLGFTAPWSFRESLIPYARQPIQSFHTWGFDSWLIVNPAWATLILNLTWTWTSLVHFWYVQSADWVLALAPDCRGTGIQSSIGWLSAPAGPAIIHLSTCWHRGNMGLWSQATLALALGSSYGVIVGIGDLIPIVPLAMHV